MTIRGVSYGGGVQSTALLVLAATGVIDYPHFFFANVGDDSESPKTLRYIEDHAIPYAAAHDIELVVLRWMRRNGTPGETLKESLLADKTASIKIPMYRPDKHGKGAPVQRQCTSRWKIEVVNRELRRRGATPEDPAVMAIGFSCDEIERVGGGSRNAWVTNTYPLIQDVSMRRDECEALIARNGLPVPPKSSCYFCPYHSMETWRRMKRLEPEEFEQAVVLERDINRKLAKHERKPMFLTRSLRPLDEVVDDDQGVLFGEFMGESGCDEGYCWT